MFDRSISIIKGNDINSQALELDLAQSTRRPVKTIPVVIGATGVIHKDLSSKLKELDCDIDVKQLQKIATIETIRIVKSFLIHSLDFCSFLAPNSTLHL